MRPLFIAVALALSSASASADTKSTFTFQIDTNAELAAIAHQCGYHEVRLLLHDLSMKYWAVQPGIDIGSELDAFLQAFDRRVELYRVEHATLRQREPESLTCIDMKKRAEAEARNTVTLIVRASTGWTPETPPPPAAEVTPATDAPSP